MNALVCGVAVLFLLGGCGKAQDNDAAQVKQDVTAQRNIAESAVRIDRLLTEGTALLSQGYIPAALKTFDEAIKENPNDSRGYIALGQAYVRIKKLDQAIETFKMILDFSPENAEAHYLIAMAHGLKGERDTAAQYAQKSMQLAQSQKDQPMFLRSAAMLKGLADAQQGVGN